MKLANLNPLNLGELLGGFARRVLSIGGQFLLGLDCTGRRRKVPLFKSTGLKHQDSSFYRQCPYHSVMTRTNVQLTKVNLVTSAGEPRIYNGAPGYHVWPVGELSNLCLIHLQIPPPQSCQNNLKRQMWPCLSIQFSNSFFYHKFALPILGLIFYIDLHLLLKFLFY